MTRQLGRFSLNYHYNEEDFGKQYFNEVIDRTFVRFLLD